jgi:hypothetical protein
MTFAADLYAKERAFENADDQMFEHLSRIFPGIDCQKITYDDYDFSFEVLGCTPFELNPTKEQLDAVKELGFLRFWIHRNETRDYSETRLDNEKYFSLEYK